MTTVTISEPEVGVDGECFECGVLTKNIEHYLGYREYMCPGCVAHLGKMREEIRQGIRHPYDCLCLAHR